MLKSSSRSVAAVAAEVGYESEAAFNRAFKREYRVAPVRFRSESLMRCACIGRPRQEIEECGSSW